MSSSNYTSVIQSLVPRLQQPQWKRSVRKEDTQPTLLSLEKSDNHLCLVCHKNQCRYTCPRCEVPYCSVGCYKHHDVDGTATPCTEAFYQDRVSSVLSLEQKERSKEMHDILKRAHADELEDSPDILREDDARFEYVLSDEELWALSDALDSGFDLSGADLDDLVSPRIKKALAQAMERGDLSKVLAQWQPWWTAELVSNTDMAIDTAKSDEQENLTTEQPLLDERLMTVPSFDLLWPGKRPSWMLQYNLVDLLYSTARTLRLYHGVENAVSSCREAAATLLLSSEVLSNDARYESIADVMAKCAAASTKALASNGECNAQWTILSGDVTSMIRNRRFIARALFDSIDIVIAAIKTEKEARDTARLARLRLAKKKLNFYLSWSRSTDLLSTAESEIHDWIEEWKYLFREDESALPRGGWLPEGNTGTASMIGSSSKEISRMRQPVEATDPLISEVSPLRRK